MMGNANGEKIGEERASDRSEILSADVDSPRGGDHSPHVFLEYDSCREYLWKIQVPSRANAEFQVGRSMRVM